MENIRVTEKPEFKTNSGTSPYASVVVPLLNESESLAELYSQLEEALNGRYSWEIVFVDDGSTDNSWEVIQQLQAQHGNVKGVRFRRNYGKSTALQHGFQESEGKVVVTMDADLQDDPFEVPGLIDMLIEKDLDLLSGWKKKRYDPLSKTIPSRFFNFITSKVTKIKLHDFNCGLKAYKREVVERLDLYGEMHRYIPLLAYWDGFRKIDEKPVQHHPRKYGDSKFGLSRFINGFLDLLTLIFVNFYQQKPMHFFGTAGSAFLVVGGGITLYLAFMRIFFDQYLAGRPLLLFGILLLLVGLQFFMIGLFGEMVYRYRRDNHSVNVREKTGTKYE